MSSAIQPFNSLKSIKNPTTKPAIPEKGDIAACAVYAHETAAVSDNTYETLGSIWIRFINWSFLNDSPRAGR